MSDHLRFTKKKFSPNPCITYTLSRFSFRKRKCIGKPPLLWNRIQFLCRKLQHSSEADKAMLWNWNSVLRTAVVSFQMFPKRFEENFRPVLFAVILLDMRVPLLPRRQMIHVWERKNCLPGLRQSPFLPFSYQCNRTTRERKTFYLSRSSLNPAIIPCGLKCTYVCAYSLRYPREKKKSTNCSRSIRLLCVCAIHSLLISS